MKLIRQTDKESLNRIYDDMSRQFPSCERKTRKGFLSLFKDENYHAFVAHCGGCSVGYCIVYAAGEYAALWLDYLAVFEDFHSKGYGGKILFALKENFPDFKGCFLEVEKPDEELPNTIRRINFYKKLGAQDTGMVYFYPSRKDCLEMDLYFLPFDENVTPAKEETRKVIRYIFNHLYHDIKHIEMVYDRIK